MVSILPEYEDVFITFGIYILKFQLASWADVRYEEKDVGEPHRCSPHEMSFSGQFVQSVSQGRISSRKNWKIVEMAEMEYAPYCKLVWKPRGFFFAG